MSRTGTEFGRISGTYKTYNIGTWQLSSQNLNDNKSTFKLRDYFTYEGGTQASSTYSTFKIDGTTVKSGSYAYNPGDTQLGTKDIQVTHNNDGSFPGRSITISADSYHISGSKSGSITGVPTIPRASSVTATEACVEAATSITIARVSSSFSHTLKYSCGNLSGTIIEKTTETTVGWIIPSDFYNQMLDKIEIECIVACETYNGSTKIGEKTTSFKVKVDTEKNKPTITATLEDVNSKTAALTGDVSKIVKFYSNVQASLSATGKNGATITSKSITCADGQSLVGDGIMYSVESSNFTVAAKDSRGIIGTKDYNLSFIDYIKLTINANFYRPQPTTGEMAVTFKGNCFRGSFGQVTNTLNVLYRYRKKGDTTWSSWTTLTTTISGNTYSNGPNPISLGKGFDYREQYEFQIRANDKINTADELTTLISVAAGEPIFDVGKYDFNVNVILNVLNKLGEKKNILDVIDELILERDEIKHPIGDLIFNMSGTNPKDYLGFGTWVLVAAGKFLVGVDKDDTDFDEAGKTGGEKTHKLTSSELPKLTGQAKFRDISISDSNTIISASGILSRNNESWSGSHAAMTTSGKDTYYYNNLNINFGGDVAHNNIPPFYACYVFQRTG